MGIKKIFGKIKKSKDGKVLAENFAYLSLLQIAGYVFPLLTIPYLAVVIGVDGFGKIAFASAIITWVRTVTDWGFNYTATRDVSKNREDKEKVSEIFSNILWSRILLMIISFIIIVALIFLIPKFKENASVILVSFLIIPGQIFFPDWFFQAIEKMKYTTILNVLSKFIFTLAVFVFIKEKSDYILQPLLNSMGFMISGIIALFLILKKWNIKLKKPSLPQILSTIKHSTDVFINNLMPNLYNSFSTILLGFYGGSTATGKLDSGTKFVNVCQQFMQIISRTFFPFLSRRIDKHSFYAKMNIYLAAACSLGLFAAAPLLIKIFFTKEFYDATMILQITSISILFLSLSNIYGTNYMIIEGYEKKLRNTTIATSIIGFAISFPLIYFYEVVGAAVTITFTRALLGISVMIQALKIKKAKKDKKTTDN